MRSISSNIAPSVSARQMREIDDLVIRTFDITLAQMMENAGRSLAELVIDQYQVSSVTVLVGPGHNGGGGLVAARHLFNRGVEVTVVP
ncbi:MAG TPA: NAD(P)H-hydrate epimerase, partial [Acidimicrobiales bacterium]|nr:NAD(P)H-hydrate epimerase [Acidimicrobiales bacterium]